MFPFEQQAHIVLHKSRSSFGPSVFLPRVLVLLDDDSEPTACLKRGSYHVFMGRVSRARLDVHTACLSLIYNHFQHQPKLTITSSIVLDTYHYAQTVGLNRTW
jgi:hypothetical protein